MGILIHGYWHKIYAHPILFRSSKLGKIDLIYAHVQISNKITLNKL